MAFRTLTFNDLSAWDRVLGAIWVGDRYVTVVADRDLRPLWQRRLATFVLVGVFDRLDDVLLFRVGQLGWVIDFNLVARHHWFIFFVVGLLFHDLITSNQIRGFIRVGDRYIPVVTNRNIRPLWQGRLATFILVSVFDRGFNGRFFVFGQIIFIINFDLVSRQLWLIRFRISPLHFHRDADLFTGLIRISNYDRRAWRIIAHRHSVLPRIRRPIGEVGMVWNRGRQLIFG